MVEGSHGEGTPDEPSELVELKERLADDLAKLDKGLHDLNKAYRRHLEKQKSSFQQQGNLRAVVMFEEELKEFESKEGDLSPLTELAGLQKIYRDQRAKLLVERKKQALPIIAGYQKRAETLASEWTRFNRIEDARLAQAEADRLARRLQKSSVPLPKKTDSMISPFAGDEAGDEWKNGVRMKFCWCPRGEFTMGSPPNEVGRTDDEDQAEVTVSRGFWMGKFEVTEEEFEKVTGETPSLRGDSNFESKERPVAHVTWDEARKFCELLTEQEHTRGIIPEGWKYDLPTEAQWEYACRAGTTGPFVGEPPSDYGWIAHNRVELVGLKKPNPWGIHDMHGNVREFCRDAYRKELMGGVDPFIEVMGPNEQVVFRGGFYNPPAERCRAANRRHVPRSFGDHSIGFRIALFQD